MSAPPKISPSRAKVRRHREKLRAQGLRPVTLWLPDTRTPEFKDQAHKQSLAVARSEQEAEDQAFIDSLSDPFGEAAGDAA